MRNAEKIRKALSYLRKIEAERDPRLHVQEAINNVIGILSDLDEREGSEVDRLTDTIHVLEESLKAEKEKNAALSQKCEEYSDILFQKERDAIQAAPMNERLLRII